MVDLVAVFGGLGYTEIATYVQSGNVVFSAKKAPDPVAIEQAIEKRFAFAPAIMVRSTRELADIVKRCPYLDGDPDHAKLHVVMHGAAPTKPVAPSPPDRFAIDGREIFVYYANGIGKTKLRLDAGTPGTARNWRSVLAVLDLL